MARRHQDVWNLAQSPAQKLALSPRFYAVLLFPQLLTTHTYRNTQVELNSLSLRPFTLNRTGVDLYTIKVIHNRFGDLRFMGCSQTGLAAYA